MRTQELRQLMRRHFRPNGWAVFEEVRSETGWTQGKTTRSADMIALGLWRSKGISLHGFELKVSRSDWLREKVDPEKSEPFRKFVDRWWIVAGDENIVRPGELPAGWGLIVPNIDALTGKTVGLRYAYRAKLLKAEPLDRLFVAALVRRIAEGGWQAMPPVISGAA
jgi:hypothetical protein